MWCYAGVMPEDDIRTTVRLPAKMHQQLKARAARHHRSDHAQILTYIELGLAMEAGEYSPLELAILGNPEVRQAIMGVRPWEAAEMRRQ